MGATRDAVSGSADYGTIETREKQGSGISAVRLDLTAGPNGVVSALIGCVGRLERLVTVPGTAGDQPNDQWDLTVTDEDGIQLFQDTGISNSSAEVGYPSGTNLQQVFGQLTFLVQNAGSNNKVSIIAYFH